MNGKKTFARGISQGKTSCSRDLIMNLNLQIPKAFSMIHDIF